MLPLQSSLLTKDKHGTAASYQFSNSLVRRCRKPVGRVLSP
jgi:hypothetical protein